MTAAVIFNNDNFPLPILAGYQDLGQGMILCPDLSRIERDFNNRYLFEDECVFYVAVVEDGVWHSMDRLKEGCFDGPRTPQSSMEAAIEAWLVARSAKESAVAAAQQEHEEQVAKLQKYLETNPYPYEGWEYLDCRSLHSDDGFASYLEEEYGIRNPQTGEVIWALYCIHRPLVWAELQILSEEKAARQAAIPAMTTEEKAQILAEIEAKHAAIDSAYAAIEAAKPPKPTKEEIAASRATKEANLRAENADAVALAESKGLNVFMEGSYLYVGGYHFIQDGRKARKTLKPSLQDWYANERRQASLGCKKPILRRSH